MRRFLARGFRKLSRMIDPTLELPSIDIADEYVNWLCFANPGMLDRGNLYSIDLAIRNIPADSAIVEIGSFCGLSTNLLSYYKQKHGAANPLFTCDRWDFERPADNPMLGESTVPHAEYRDFVRESFMRNVRMFSRPDLPHTIEATSDEFFAAWDKGGESEDVFGRRVKLGGPIGFAYVDGNHSYEFAKRDFENCARFLAPGGYILLDDSADGSGWEVCRVAAEAAADSRYELAAKNPNYMFRKR